MKVALKVLVLASLWFVPGVSSEEPEISLHSAPGLMGWFEMRLSLCGNAKGGVITLTSTEMEWSNREALSVTTSEGESLENIARRIAEAISSKNVGSRDIGPGGAYAKGVNIFMFNVYRTSFTIRSTDPGIPFPVPPPVTDARIVYAEDGAVTITWKKPDGVDRVLIQLWQDCLGSSSGESWTDQSLFADHAVMSYQLVSVTQGNPGGRVEICRDDRQVKDKSKWKPTRIDWPKMRVSLRGRASGGTICLTVSPQVRPPQKPVSVATEPGESVDEIAKRLAKAIASSFGFKGATSEQGDVIITKGGLGSFSVTSTDPGIVLPPAVKDARGVRAKDGTVTLTWARTEGVDEVIIDERTYHHRPARVSGESWTDTTPGSRRHPMRYYLLSCARGSPGGALEIEVPLARAEATAPGQGSKGASDTKRD